MTNEIGTSTHNITFNDHVDVAAELRELAAAMHVSMGQLLRQLLEIGVWSITPDIGNKIHKLHTDYYGASYWEAEAAA